MHRTELLPVAAEVNIRAGPPAAGVKNSSVQLASINWDSRLELYRLQNHITLTGRRFSLSST